MNSLGQHVRFVYRGSYPDGTVFDDGADGHEIILGSHQIMAALEDALMEMEIGEERTIHLEAKDAYGDYNPEAVQKVPAFKIPNGENIPVGEMIAWRTPRSQEPIPAKVLSVDNGVITLDFNHPLAGQDIDYWIRLESVSD